MRTCVWNPLTLSGSACGAEKASISNFRFRPVLADLELKPAPGGTMKTDGNRITNTCDVKGTVRQASKTEGT